MNPQLVGRKAFYKGQSRPYLKGAALPIVDQRVDGSAVAFENPLTGKAEWVNSNSIELFPEASVFDDIDEFFNRAAGTDRERLDVEIKRLEARLSELKMARRVLDTI